MGSHKRGPEYRGEFDGFAAGKLEEYPKQIFGFLEFS
jgi:hypothetical protein